VACAGMKDIYPFVCFLSLSPITVRGTCDQKVLSVVVGHRRFGDYMGLVRVSDTKP
jgi:hypothetical protein